MSNHRDRIAGLIDDLLDAKQRYAGTLSALQVLLGYFDGEGAAWANRDC